MLGSSTAMIFDHKTFIRLTTVPLYEFTLQLKTLRSVILFTKTQLPIDYKGCHQYVACLDYTFLLIQYEALIVIQRPLFVQYCDIFNCYVRRRMGRQKC